MIAMTINNKNDSDLNNDVNMINTNYYINTSYNHSLILSGHVYTLLEYVVIERDTKFNMSWNVSEAKPI